MVSEEEAGAGPSVRCSRKGLARGREDGGSGEVLIPTTRAAGSGYGQRSTRRGRLVARPVRQLETARGYSVPWSAAVCFRGCGGGDNSWPVTVVCSGEVTAGKQQTAQGR